MIKRAVVRRERGYALLILLFMVALLSFAAAVAVPRVLVQGQREKEEEMVFRGEQYARAIGLYYKRYGRFPQKMEELVEPKNNIRFLRQLYKNPMRRDGQWRILRVAPDGTILGSMMVRSRLGVIAPAAGGGLLPTSGAGRTGAPQAPPAALPALPSYPPPQLAPEPSAGEPQQVPQPPGEGEQESAPGETQQPPLEAPPETPAQPEPEAAPPPPPPTPTPVEAEVLEVTGARAIGSGIIGVAGTSYRASIRVYNKGTRYVEWEFLYDPTAEARAALERGLKQGQSPPGQQPQR